MAIGEKISLTALSTNDANEKNLLNTMCCKIQIKTL